MAHQGRPYTRDEDLDNYLSHRVYPALFERLNTAFPDFGFDRRGDHWVATRWPLNFPCPVEHERPDRLMVYADRPYWIKVHGHSGVRFLDLVNGGRKPAGREFVEAARRLCELAGVSFLSRNLTPEQDEAAQGRESRRSVLDSTIAFGEKALWSDEGKTAREYLAQKRGFTEEEIRSLRFGLYSSTSDLETWLNGDGQDLQVARDAGILWRALSGYIMIPWCDDFGRPLTLYGRWHTQTPPEGKPKTIALPGEGTKGSPLYFDRARVAGHRDLVLVEGVFDAALLQVRGDTRVVASVAAQLSGLQLETLRHHQIKRAFICGDPDGGGDRGTLANIAALDRGGIQAFVVPRLPDGCDPDEYVISNGINGWRALVDNSLHAYEFLARAIVEKHKGAQAWTSVQLTAAIDDAIEFDRKTVNPERETDLDLFFWPTIRGATGVSAEALAERLEAVHNKKRTEQEAREYEELIRRADEALAEGNLPQVKSIFRDDAGRLQLEERKRNAEPVVLLVDDIAAHVERINRFRGAPYIGLVQRTIPKLDDSTLGLRGLMVLGAPPNVGKTVLTVQWGTDVVIQHPEACFVFLSLEMSRWDIMTRILCRLARMNWHTLVLGTSRAGGQTLFTEDEGARIVQAEERMKTIGRRILILDERNFPAPTLEGLLAHTGDLKGKTGATRAFVLIDYLQVWQPPDHILRTLRTDIEADKWRIGQMKELRDSLGDTDAICVISEARKPAGNSGEKWGGALADLMGSARNSYTPDMAFLLHPFTDGDFAHAFNLYKQAKGGGPPKIDKKAVDEYRVRIDERGLAYNKLIIAKGRDGVRKEDLDITFRFRQSAFEQGLLPL
jgi:DNA primase